MGWTVTTAGGAKANNGFDHPDDSTNQNAEMYAVTDYTTYYNVTLTQDLGWVAEGTYTVSFDGRNDSAIGRSNIYTPSLMYWDNGTSDWVALVPDGGEGTNAIEVDPNQDTNWRTYAAGTYSVSSSSPLIGSALQVHIEVARKAGQAGTGCWTELDNFAVNGPVGVPTPEPSVSMLLITGLFGMLCYARTKRK
jgi:hypothetical protein